MTPNPTADEARLRDHETIWATATHCTHHDLMGSAATARSIASAGRALLGEGKE